VKEQVTSEDRKRNGPTAIPCGTWDTKRVEKNKSGSGALKRKTATLNNNNIHLCKDKKCIALTPVAFESSRVRTHI
jgi:stalled ribosome alternative rescue factor ArfA